MTPVNVLVVFYSRYGTAEQLALAVGLGAIQAKGSIRLRRLPDLASPDTIAADGSWREHLERMNRDYVAPRPADPAWADVVVLATSSASPEEVEQYCRSLQAALPLTGKLAGPVTPGNREDALRTVYAAAACAGFLVVPAGIDAADPIASAQAFGRRLVEIARALKARTEVVPQ